MPFSPNIRKSGDSTRPFAWHSHFYLRACAIVRIFLDANEHSVQCIFDELIIYLFIYDSKRVKWSLHDLELWIRLPTTRGIHLYHIFYVHFPCKNEASDQSENAMSHASDGIFAAARKHRQHGQWALCTDHRPCGTCSVSYTAHTRPLCSLQSIIIYKKCALLITVGRNEWKKIKKVLPSARRMLNGTKHIR